MIQINDFPNYYITKKGKIWSSVNTRYHKPKWLKNILGKHGYLYVNLTKNNKRYVKYIHRLLLEHFVNSCPNGMECRHLDNNKLNNFLGNLCWGTRSENQHDNNAMNVWKRKDTGKWTSQITKNYKTINLGCFDNEEESRKAYINAKQKFCPFYKEK